MTWLAALVSTVIGIVSPIGVGGEALATQQIRQRLIAAESLVVRVDNAPSHQIVQGRLDKLRIAGRGLVPLQDLRIDQLDIETDPIQLQGLKAKLKAPLQAGVNLVVTEEDINRALASKPLRDRLQKLGGRVFNQTDQVDRYEFSAPQIRFLADRRLRLQVDVRERGYDGVLNLKIETGIDVINGRLIQLIDTQITANEQAVPAAILNPIMRKVNEELDLNRLESRGMTARVLQWEMRDRRLQVATFVQIRP
jgi:LmeA-like phospholipid-binding